jgi:hypothetical protein
MNKIGKSLSGTAQEKVTFKIIILCFITFWPVYFHHILLVHPRVNLRRIIGSKAKQKLQCVMCHFGFGDRRYFILLIGQKFAACHFQITTSCLLLSKKVSNKFVRL